MRTKTIDRHTISIPTDLLKQKPSIEETIYSTVLTDNSVLKLGILLTNSNFQPYPQNKWMKPIYIYIKLLSEENKKENQNISANKNTLQKTITKKASTQHSKLN